MNHLFFSSVGTSVDEQDRLKQNTSSAVGRKSNLGGGKQMRYRIAILALAALYFGSPPTHMGEKNARQASPEHPPTAAEQPLVKSL